MKFDPYVSSIWIFQKFNKLQIWLEFHPGTYYQS
jgi:hypothetical protein